MNVIRHGNSPQGASYRNRSNRRGRGRYGPFRAEQNVVPKYHFDMAPRGNFRNINPLSTPSTWRTPRRGHNRGRIATGSSYIPTTSRGITSESANCGTKTPGTASTYRDSHIILAITSGRGDARGEVGMAAIDARFPSMILCQISDCQTYTNTLTKVYVFDPVEVIMPDTMCQRNSDKNTLYRAIKENFSNVSITPVNRFHFNESIGFERIKTHCAKEYCAVELFIRHKYYALAAVAALLKYVEFIQHIIYTPKSMKIEFEGSPNTCMIDIESARSLELVTSECGQPNITLLATMNKCSTPMGRRLLRVSILQPPCDPKIIMERQCCVEEMVTNKSLHNVVQPVVRQLYGADRLLSLSMVQNVQTSGVNCAERNLNYILLLKNSLEAVPELHKALLCAQSTFFVKARENLKNESFNFMKEEISNVINEPARAVMGYTSSNMQRCFAVKVGINALLDIARQTYCELIDDMQTMVENLASKYNLPVALGCNANLGYHIQMDLPRGSQFRVDQLPAEFIKIESKRNTFFMTTNALLVYSKQCTMASEELHVMSNTVLTKLLASIRTHIGCLFQLSADVAELDLILSLAQISNMSQYIKPVFGPILNVKNSIHPILSIFGTERPIVNDMYASVPYNFHNILGPNMSGKTVYLKQVVLLTIMAQIGSYVPAGEAEFRITDRIMCRLSQRDAMECNTSMFVLEVKKIQHILRTVTPKSLVILDELCSATTVEEGTSIAWAICERLLKTRAFIFSVTHFSYLTKLADLYPNVTNHCFETVTKVTAGSNNPRLIYTHKLQKGIGSMDNYGINLAELSGLPETVISKAREYASTEHRSGEITDGESATKVAMGNLFYDRVAQLYNLLNCNQFAQENVMKVVMGLNRIVPRQMQGSIQSPSTSKDTHQKVVSINEKVKIVRVSCTNPPRALKRIGAPIKTDIPLKLVTSSSQNSVTDTSHGPHSSETDLRHHCIKGVESGDADISSNSQDQIKKQVSVTLSSVQIASLAGTLSPTLSRLSIITDIPDSQDTFCRCEDFFEATNTQISNSNISMSTADLALDINTNSFTTVNLSPVFTLESFPTQYLSALDSITPQRVTSNLSNISNLTEIAEKTARQREANIFKKIVGKNFNETELLAPKQVPVFIDLTRNDD